MSVVYDKLTELLNNGKMFAYIGFDCTAFDDLKPTPINSLFRLASRSFQATHLAFALCCYKSMAYRASSHVIN